MANARKVVFDSTTFIPTPGSMEITAENQDGGNDKVGAGYRNATAWVLKFEFVPGASITGSTNPSVAATEALRTQTYSLPDTDAHTASMADESATLIELTQATLTVDSADGDGAVICKCSIKGNLKTA